MSTELPGYDEPLDDPLMDPDPGFREVLRILNATGVHTVSSCQGHAPGTQYDHVHEWMDPYITCVVPTSGLIDARNLLRAIGGKPSSDSVDSGKLVAKFPRGWDWKRSVKALKARPARQSRR
jgi:hypothetical protein